MSAKFPRGGGGSRTFFSSKSNRFVNGMLHSVVFGTFDWMKLISNSLSDNVMGSFKFEATVTK